MKKALGDYVARLVLPSATGGEASAVKRPGEEAERLKEAMVAYGDGKDKTFYPSTARTFFDAASRP
jgi:hypothetical protein